MLLFTLLTDALCVAALLLWGWLLCRALRLPAGFGPALGTAAALAGLQAAGALNLLWPGAVLFLVLPFLLAGFFCLRRGAGAGLRQYFTAPAVLAFGAACLLLEVVYALRTPRFQTWDEFSHWGVFFKTVFYQHRFDIWVAGRSFMHQAYPQGAAGLYALFALLKGSYAERDVFFAATLPLFAAGSALFACLPAGGDAAPRRARPARLLAAVLAVPLLFAVFAPDTPYTTVYMDAPVGALFAAALCLVIWLPGRAAGPDCPGGWRGSLAVGLLCAAAATLKEIGAVFALCVLGILAVQALCAAWGQAPRRAALQNFCAALLPGAALAGGSILLWKAVLLPLHRATDQFSSMGLGYFLTCWQEARTGADPYFYSVWGVFYARIRTYPLLFGWSPFKLGMVCAALSLLLAGLLFRFGRGQGGRRAAAAPLLMCLYYPCYLAVLFYVYIGGMSATEAMQAASWERYTCCFFIGWFGALLAGAFRLAEVLPALPRAPRPLRRPGRVLTGALCLLLAGGSVLPLAGRGLSAFVLPAEPWRDEQIATAAALRAAIRADGGTEDSAVWLLSAEGDTAYQRMWYYHYELTPDNVCIEVPSSEEGVDLAYNLGEHQIEYLVLFGVTDAFRTQYAAWFTDGLAVAEAAGVSPVLYRVTNENGWRLTPAAE